MLITSEFAEIVFCSFFIPMISLNFRVFTIVSHSVLIVYNWFSILLFSYYLLVLTSMPLFQVYFQDCSQAMFHRLHLNSFFTLFCLQYFKSFENSKVFTCSFSFVFTVVASASSHAHDNTSVQRISEKFEQNNEFATSIVYCSLICASLCLGPSLKKILAYV